MCASPGRLVPVAKQNDNSQPRTCFSCSRLNRDTFLIVEDDKYFEHPFIYVKLCKDVVVLIDTGCGGAARDDEVTLRSLRRFLETYPVTDNDNDPLNANGDLHYLVICTHCHYDHIGGIAEFTDDRCTIWASDYDKPFLDEEHLPTSSLCRFVGMQTPKYAIDVWAEDGAVVSHATKDLGLTILHTPGHTPDELAVWDSRERVLFVGDTLYERAPIIFPLEASIVDFSKTIGHLRQLVDHWNEDASKSRAQIACGHVTKEGDAAAILRDVDKFVYDVLTQRIAPFKEEEIREEKNLFYERQDGRLCLRAPMTLLTTMRENEKAMNDMAKRLSLD